MADMFTSTSRIHPSAFHASAGPLELAAAETRGSGALRYQCPVTETFVLVTDDQTLDTMGGSRGLRHRCPACGEMHMVALTSDAPAGERRWSVSRP